MGLLGEILCKMAGLKQSQLKRALQEQKEQKEQSGRNYPLGHILIKYGYITEEQLYEALITQKAKKASLLQQ